MGKTSLKSYSKYPQGLKKLLFCLRRTFMVIFNGGIILLGSTQLIFNVEEVQRIPEMKKNTRLTPDSEGL